MYFKIDISYIFGISCIFTEYKFLNKEDEYIKIKKRNVRVDKE